VELLEARGQLERPDLKDRLGHLEHLVRAEQVVHRVKLDPRGLLEAQAPLDCLGLLVQPGPRETLDLVGLRVQPGLPGLQDLPGLLEHRAGLEPVELPALQVLLELQVRTELQVVLEQMEIRVRAVNRECLECLELLEVLDRLGRLAYRELPGLQAR